MLDDTGEAPLAGIVSDPWGQVELGHLAPVGVTGDLQDPATGLVNLRARWYHCQRMGRFQLTDGE